MNVKIDERLKSGHLKKERMSEWLLNLELSKLYAANLLGIEYFIYIYLFLKLFYYY